MNVNDMGLDELRLAVAELRRYPAEVARLEAEIKRLNGLMVECEACGFEYHRQHFERDKPCPVCEAADCRAETERLQPVVEAIRKYAELKAAEPTREEWAAYEATWQGVVQEVTQYRPHGRLAGPQRLAAEAKGADDAS